MSEQNQPTNLQSNGSTDSLSIFGFTAHQQQSYLNNQASKNIQQQRELQLLQSLLQQEPNQLKQSPMQSTPQETVSRPAHDLGGILSIISSIPPSTIASLPPDLQSQLLRSLANPTSSQNIDKLLALVEKQSILDRARAANEMEIKKILQENVKDSNNKDSSNSSNNNNNNNNNSIKFHPPREMIKVGELLNMILKVFLPEKDPAIRLDNRCKN